MSRKTHFMGGTYTTRCRVRPGHDDHGKHPRVRGAVGRRIAELYPDTPLETLPDGRSVWTSDFQPTHLDVFHHPTKPNDPVLRPYAVVEGMRVYATWRCAKDIRMTLYYLEQSRPSTYAEIIRLVVERCL
jgi:hypothetical protein